MPSTSWELTIHSGAALALYHGGTRPKKLSSPLSYYYYFVLFILLLQQNIIIINVLVVALAVEYIIILGNRPEP